MKPPEDDSDDERVSSTLSSSSRHHQQQQLNPNDVVHTIEKKIVEEIRSSLFNATRIMDHDTDRCSSSEGVYNNPSSSPSPWAASSSSSTSSSSSSSSTTSGTRLRGGETILSSSAAAAAASTTTKDCISLRCGRVKYSHVKREWNVRHRPVPLESFHRARNTTTTLDDIRGSSLLSSSSLESPSSSRLYKRRTCPTQEIGSAVPAQSRWVAGLSLRVDCEDDTKRTDRILGGRDRQRLLELTEHDENHHDNTNVRNDVMTNSQEGGPYFTPPPLELVQSILRGAEFVSMLQVAQTDLPSNGSVTLSGPIRTWSRLTWTDPIDLQPLLAHFASLAGNDSNISESYSVLLYRVLDQCINLSNMRIRDLIAPWRDTWQIRVTYDGSIVNLDNLPDESTGSDQSDTHQHGSCTSVMKHFVQACLVPFSLQEMESYVVDEKASLRCSRSMSQADDDDSSNPTPTTNTDSIPEDQQRTTPANKRSLGEASTQKIVHEHSSSSEHEASNIQQAIPQQRNIPGNPLRSSPLMVTSTPANTLLELSQSPPRRRVARRREESTRLVQSPLVSATTSNPNSAKSSPNIVQSSNGRKRRHHSIGDADLDKDDYDDEKLQQQEKHSSTKNITSLNDFFDSSTTLNTDRRPQPGPLRQSPRRRLVQWIDDMMSPLLGTGGAAGRERTNGSRKCEKKKTSNRSSPTRIRPQQRSHRKRQLVADHDEEAMVGLEKRRVTINPVPITFELERHDPSNEDSDGKGDELDQEGLVELDNDEDDDEGRINNNSNCNDKDDERKMNNIPPAESFTRSVEVNRHENDGVDMDDPKGDDGNIVLKDKPTIIRHTTAAAAEDGNDDEQAQNITKLCLSDLAHDNDVSRDTTAKSASSADSGVLSSLVVGEGLGPSDPSTHNPGEVPRRRKARSTAVQDKIPPSQRKPAARALPSNFKKGSNEYDKAEEDSPGRLFYKHGREVRPQEISGTSWVRLSHMGHISDYHGFARSYDNFYPLKFRSSLAEMQEEIKKTLLSSQHGLCRKVTDKDIAREVEEYEKAAIRNETLATEERKRKRKLSREKSSGGQDGSKFINFKNLEQIPIVFGSALENDDEADKCARPGAGGSSCNFSSNFFDENPISQPSAKYKYIERDEGIIHYSDDEDDDGGGSNKKRRSRRTEIASQKNTSYRMLTELLNTLSFIEEYNAGFNGNDHGQKQPDDVDEVEIPCSVKAVFEEGTKKNSKPLPPTKHIQKKTRTTPKTTPTQDEMIPVPKRGVLNHIGLLRSYNNLQKKNSSFYLLTTPDRTVPSAQTAITKILDTDDTLPIFFHDDGIALEEKEYIRALRSYRGKADQERIEKKFHDEKTKLEKREFEYYRDRGHKRLTPLQIEVRMVRQRQIEFVEGDKGLPEELEACPFGIKCPICTQVLQDESGHPEKETIFLPRFHRVDDESCLPTTEDTAAEEKLPTCREVRCPQLKSQKTVSALKLAELYNTLSFIEEYNAGFNSNEHAQKQPDHVEVKIRHSNKTVSKEDAKKISKPLPPTKQQDIVEVKIRHSTKTVSKEDTKKNSKPLPPTKHIQKKPRTNLKTATTQSEITSVPKWAALNHFSLLRTYDNLQKKNTWGKSVASAQTAIRKVLDGDDTLSIFFHDDDIAVEEKEYIRALRLYRSKADRERIEKKFHDERAKLEKRAFEYYRDRGHLRLTPLQKEVRMVRQRQIEFVEGDKGLPEDLEACPFGIECPICTQVLQDEPGHPEKETIFLPRFHRVGDESCLLSIQDTAAEEEPPTCREARWAQLKSQKTVSALKLAELYNTLSFVELYNGGLITGETRST